MLGAGLAGLSAARALRGAGFTGEVTVVGAERHRPYDRPPLSKDFLTGTGEPADLSLEKPAEDLSVTWLLGDAATALDPTAGTVTLRSGRTVHADGFVVATGARARTLPGVDALGGVHTLRTLDDAVALRADLARAKHLVVVGAGFIGAEVASTARGLDRGLDITVVETLPTPLAGPLGAEMGAIVGALHGNHGVRLHCGQSVAALERGAGQRVARVRLLDGTVLPADVVVVGVGAVPAVDWLAGSGLVLEDTGGIRCDAAGGTGAGNVVALGDCAAWFEPRLGRHVRVEHWTSASDRARAAVRTLLGQPAGPVRQPYFWSDQYGVRIQFAGHAVAGDEVAVEQGDPGEHRFLAVYRRAGLPVAVLAVDLVGPFAKWRRQLERN